MNIICAICKDYLVQSDDIFHTPCSHIFHFGCLTQWLERSKTCPQCRERVTQNKINRLFFTFPNNESVHSQPSTIQEKMDNLQFKIMLKEKDIQYYTSKTVTLEKQNAGLRSEIYKVESEISKQNSIIYELQEEMKYCDELKKEVTQLRSALEKLEPIRLLLHGPVGDVNEMVGRTRDPDALIKYISVLKKMLVENIQKKKEVRTAVKKYQNKLIMLNQKCVSLTDNRQEMQEKLAISESKNMSLQQRVDELEEILDIKDKSIDILPSEKVETRNSSSRTKGEKCSQESSSKSPTPTKRKKEKISNTDKSNVDEWECECSSFDKKDQADLTDSNSSTISLISPKRSRISINDRKSSNKGNSSRSSRSAPKKRRENKAQTSTADDTENVGVIDLT